MNQMQFRAPPLTKINKYIIIVAAACFLLHSILTAVGAFSLPGLFGLSASSILHGFFFQFLTYPFIETQAIGLLFNCLVVWFIGSELESQWGSKVYLRFLALNVLGVGVIFATVNVLFFYGTRVYVSPLYGLSGINFAMLISYALLYPNRQMLMLFFPVTARTFCWILVAFQAYMAVFTSLMTSWAHLLAMGVSYLIIRYQSRPLLYKVLNASWSRKKKVKSNRLYVVKDEDSKPPKYWQ